MRTIGIVGTRNAAPHVVEHCAQLIHTLQAEDPETTIVTGGDDAHVVGGNIDRCASRTARSLGMETIVHIPEVFPEGHSQAGKWVGLWAGVARNSLIVRDSADGVYAFWNGLSTGTVDSIKKALAQQRLLKVFFEHGLVWHKQSGWDLLAYGAYMKEHDLFDPERIARVLVLRLQANKQSRHNHLGRDANLPIDQAKLDYANGRTVHAFNSLILGVRPTAGTGEEEGHWYVPSENKKKPDVRPHHIGLDLRCDCDAMTRGFHACFAMYLVWFHLRIISPDNMEILI